MANTLANFFMLGDAPDPETALFYALMKDQTNSAECHKVLLNLFATALRLNSYRYRGIGFTYPQEIPSSVVLDTLLTYVGSELSDPLVQVMFEQAGSATGPGNNCMLYPTFTDAASKANLENAVAAVRGIEYAGFYNNLRQTYLANPVPQGFPQEIPAPGPGNVPGVQLVQTAMAALQKWIMENDAALVSLAKTVAMTGEQIVNYIYASNQAAIGTFLFTETLCKNISAYGKQRVGPNQLARNTFLKAVQAIVTEPQSVWQDTPRLKDLAKPFVQLTSPNARYAELFGQWRELYKAALGDANLQARAKDSIVTLLNTYISAPKAKEFLFSQITLTCKTMAGCVNTDPETLARWSAEIGADLPEFWCEEYLDELMNAACACLASVPLKPLAGNAGNIITNARLFAFSDFSVIGEGRVHADFPWGVEPYQTDIVQVYNDATTKTVNKEIPYVRPVYATIRTADGKPALKFFNLGPTTLAGSFYFSDDGEPDRVLTQLADAPNTGLQFNFKSATINGLSSLPAALPGFPNLLVGTPYRNVSASGSSAAVFYAVLYSIAKWSTSLGKFKFDVVYQTSAGSAWPDTQLIWRAREGRSLSRAEMVDDSMILWESHAPADSAFQQLGEFLDLPPARRIRRNVAGGTLNIGTKAYQVLREQEVLSLGINYKFLEISEGLNAASETYVLTNTPHPNLPGALDAALNRGTKAGTLHLDSQAILRVFDFSYYRKVDVSKASTAKTLKRVSKNGSPQRPVVGDGITVDDTGLDYTTIGIGLPVSFRIRQNLFQFKTLTGGNGALAPSLKNKGSVLHRAVGARKGAGAVMKPLSALLINPPSAKTGLSASVFGNWAVKTSDNVRNNWRSLKQSGSSTLPTNQEWCHIHGHGDGGTERLGNFVGGSYHCNTEQLAIESGQRITTHSEASGTFTLVATAYLFRNEADGVMQATNYLDNDAAYTAIANVRKVLKIKLGKPPSKNSGAGTNIPFGALFRYKVERNANGSAPAKVFEHIFEGQSEFMDVHQYNILCKTTEFVLAGKAAFVEWYNEMDAALKQASLAAKKD